MRLLAIGLAWLGLVLFSVNAQAVPAAATPTYQVYTCHLIVANSDEADGDLFLTQAETQNQNISNAKSIGLMGKFQGCNTQYSGVSAQVTYFGDMLIFDIRDTDNQVAASNWVPIQNGKADLQGTLKDGRLAQVSCALRTDL